MYKLITSAKVCEDLSIGFDRDHGRRRDELTDNENVKSKVYVKNNAQDCLRLCTASRKSYLRIRIKNRINKK